ncbi:MAG: glycogen/starch/alpha-glucan phosphorylase [Methylococcales bacterium]|nr:glycogen/starch/alpha-glucan phosphorylase [Methylococcales bacterium]
MSPKTMSLQENRSALVERIRHNARYVLGIGDDELTNREAFEAIARTLRETLIDGMLDTEARYKDQGVKRLYYLSMEFLIGRSLGNSLYNLGLLEICRDALSDIGIDLEEVRQSEPDAALGNGGLGRLAACFLDSIASLDLAGYGYGLLYEFGLFRQEIRNGYQTEKPDHWNALGSPWLIERPEEACIVPIYGHIENGLDAAGSYNPMWLDWQVLVGVPSDLPVPGYGGHTINFLRLYSARSSQDFDMQIFNEGDYLRAVKQKISSETVSKILYPADTVQSGKELRLLQEYFLVACTLRDIFRRYKKEYGDHAIASLSKKVAIQLNDTHPALAVAELMRMLVDEEYLEWDEAWELTQAMLGYTNHTLLPEALEKWPVPLLEKVLPRHLQIIFEINQRFLAQVEARWPGDTKKLARVSIIEEGETKQVRMANLAIVGSHSVNGVAKLHSDLLVKNLVPDFFALWPERFNNKTNGVTPRRWLLKANPGLASLISETVGEQWITNLDELRSLEHYADDPSFRTVFLDVKQSNKRQLAKTIWSTNRVHVDPLALFDIHVKRIHEYKRQLLNLMHIIYLYLTLVEDGGQLLTPRVCIFAGKAAPGYWAAKQIIKLINNVAQRINNDQRVRGQLKVVFIPDYRVSLAESIIPAADLSEQISTAGMEASGTGNMKLAMNGALTIGTLDGANIEILEEVGDDNIYIFGLKAEEILHLRQHSRYRPEEYYIHSERVKRVMNAIKGELFCPGEPGLFEWIFKALVHQGDYYFHLADFDAYVDAQTQAAADFSQPALWARKAIMNVARMGKFSSDRTIREYAREIWDML